jgi:hypothetical protein
MSEQQPRADDELRELILAAFAHAYAHIPAAALRTEIAELRATAELVRALHRPLANTWPRQDACPDCLGGMEAEDPDEERPCGCWGLSTPICGTCCDGSSPSRRSPLQWPCPTIRALNNSAATSMTAPTVADFRSAGYVSIETLPDPEPEWRPPHTCTTYEQTPGWGHCIVRCPECHRSGIRTWRNKVPHVTWEEPRPPLPAGLLGEDAGLRATVCREGHRLRFTSPVAYAGPCCCGPDSSGEGPDCRPCCPTDGDLRAALLLAALAAEPVPEDPA